MSARSLVLAQNNPYIQYQQERLMLIDSEGDRILLKLFKDTCQTGLKKVLRHENVPPKNSQLRTPRFAVYNYVVSNNLKRKVDNERLKPLYDKDRILLDIQNIIKSYRDNRQKIYNEGRHIWCDKYFVLFKIMVALSTATTARFMYVGNEISLIEWIKMQADNSITIPELFRQSYILNKGNVYLTILTIENVLSDATFEQDRENTIVNQKLADLYEFSPNKFGDWYHFFGTMLAGYVGEKAEIIADMYTVYRKISRGKSAEKSTMDADKTGAMIGVKLKSFIDEEIKNQFAKIINDIIINKETIVDDIKF